MKAKHYIRYVDDFVIFHTSKEILENWQSFISFFLYDQLALELHLDKSKIIPLGRGVEFLGFKVFPMHRLIKRRNRRKFQRKLRENTSFFENKKVDYDYLYDFMEGWIAYAKQANTYKLKQRILAKFEDKYSLEISSKEINLGLPKQNES